MMIIGSFHQDFDQTQLEFPKKQDLIRISLNDADSKSEPFIYLSMTAVAWFD